MSLLFKDNLGRRPRKIEFTIGQSFSNLEHFPDELKELAIIKFFELHYFRTDIRMVMARCQPKGRKWEVHASIHKGGQKFLN